jgi:hypothetical protein
VVKFLQGKGWRTVAAKWSELVFSGDAAPAVLSRAVQRGTLRRLATGVYTGLVDRDPEEVVRQHLWKILDHELPGAVLVDRTAVRPTAADGVVLVDHTRVRPLMLPGVTVLPRRGGGPASGDLPFLKTSLFLSSTARQLLDNLHSSRGSGRRTLTEDEVEAWIDELVSTRREAGINRLRDEARALAPQLKRTQAMQRLDALVSAALSTGDVRAAKGARLASRAAGLPVDAQRLAAFERLAQELEDSAPDITPLLPEDQPRRALLPFYEAYFSNFIEGTEFTLDEAAEIVFDGEIPTDRPADAHDVLGTYEIVADASEMALVPRHADEFEQLLRGRHARVMSLRPEKHPGEYKSRANRAGNTNFVEPELVRGTLRVGFEIGSRVSGPFQRAVYQMFLVSEVHPFADGNGRVARIMMNAELVTAGEVRLIIPIVYRGNYLDALRGATRTGHFEGLVKTLSFARRYTAQVDFTSRVTAEDVLTRTNALRDAQEADDAGIRLLLPSRL